MKKPLSALIENKTVALVGPASYLSEFSFGPEIDSRDIVVRINRGLEIIDSHEQQVGSRTDVLYNCLIEHPDNGGKIRISELRQKGVGIVATVPHSSPKGYVKNSRLHPDVSIITKLKLRYFHNLHVMDHKLYSRLNQRIECRANTGFAAIFDILSMNPSHLFVTGFSFYLDSFFSGYKFGCDRDEDEFAEQCFVSVRHNQFNQWSCLKEEAASNNRLVFDPILSDILLMEKLDRAEFKKNLIEKTNSL